MKQLTSLESLAIAKAIAAEYRREEFSVSAFIRQHTTIRINGTERIAPEYRVARIALTVNQHYVAAVCGDKARADFVAWCKRNARAIMALEYR